MAAALRPPPGRGRIVTALVFGLVVHAIFAAAVMAMIVAMYFGMSMSLGQVPAPWSHLCNGLLLLQFPITHSLLLSQRGGRLLNRAIPVHGQTLSTTTYAIIASVQLLLLFALWTPSGVIWWRAEGVLLGVISAAYAASWLLLLKASFDAGAEVQSGALGWMSLLANRRPLYPDMPTGGLFRFIRQPIYVAFALTLWTVPIWTPTSWSSPSPTPLLPAGAEAEGTALRRPLRRTLRGVSVLRALCAAAPVRDDAARRAGRQGWT